VSTNNVVRNSSETSRRAKADKVLLSQGRLRVFEPDDIPRVASLYDRIFEGGDGKPTNRLCEYFEELFFKNPWADPSVPSWLYETNQGDIVAFQGLHPRRMVFDGEPIMCATQGQWMVAEDFRGGWLGALMKRRAFGTSPELSYGDTNIPPGRRGHSLWERAGGARVPVAGIQWEFVFTSARVSDAKDGRSAILRLANRIVNKMRLRKRRKRIEQQTDGARISEVAPDVLERLSEMLPTSMRLHPLYDVEYVSWLIKVASDTSSRGELQHSTVLSLQGDEIEGWYFFYVARNARAEVMQIVSKPGAENRVFAQLVGHASRKGAASVAGSWCGHDALVAAQSMGCYIGYLPTRTVAYSRNTEIMRAIMCGDYFLSAFEGDSWLDFSNR
jgi:hypothetical protein